MHPGSLMLWWLVAPFLATAAYGQIASTQPASGPASPRTLLERQQAIRERVQQLEGRMLKLTRLLGESEPDKAQRLQLAIESLGQKGIRRRLDAIVNLLRDGKYDVADHEQRTLVADLEQVFKLLTDTLNELERRRAERERLEAHARAIRELMDEQIGELQRTRMAQAEREQADALAQLAARLEETARQQAALRDKPRDAQAAGEQRELEKDTRAAAVDSAQTPPYPADPRTAEQRQAAAEEAAAAADAMQSAAQQMEAGGAAADAAAESQAQAEEKLRRAIQRLREEEKRLRERADLRSVERDQRQTQKSAAQRAGQMQAESQGNQQTPGGEQMRDAAQRMQNAADRLGEDQPDEAQPEQEAALQEMQQALNELDDALRQIRREEMEETLAALEQRLRSLLTREEAVRETVKLIQPAPPAEWTRGQQKQAADAAETQRSVATDCEALVRILTDEGSTVLLPEFLEQLAADMAVIATRLDQNDASPATEYALDDVIATLKEILEAVERKRQEMQEGGQGQQPGGQQSASAPLLPGSAELKLLRSSQIRINRRTDALRAAANEPLPPAAQAEFERLAGRQKQLADLAQRMNERTQTTP